MLGAGGRNGKGLGIIHFRPSVRKLQMGRQFLLKPLAQRQVQSCERHPIEIEAGQIANQPSVSYLSQGFTISMPQLTKSRIFRVAKRPPRDCVMAAICASAKEIGVPSRRRVDVRLA